MPRSSSATSGGSRCSTVARRSGRYRWALSLQSAAQTAPASVNHWFAVPFSSRSRLHPAVHRASPSRTTSTGPGRPSSSTGASWPASSPPSKRQAAMLVMPAAPSARPFHARPRCQHEAAATATPAPPSSHPRSQPHRPKTGRCYVRAGAAGTPGYRTFNACRSLGASGMPVAHEVHDVQEPPE